MNGFVGSSLYDTLNKMVIGFLLILPFLIIFCPNIDQFLKDYSLYIMIASWIIGLIYWAVYAVILGGILEKLFPYIFRPNNLEWINQEYKALKEKYKTGYKNLIDNKLTLREYFKVYYRVQKNGLFGNVPCLESYSEFFKNFIVVAGEWILIIMIVLLIHCARESGKLQALTGLQWGENVILISIVIFLIILGLTAAFARRTIEKKIYSLVMTADLLGGLAPQDLSYKINLKNMIRRFLGI